MYFETPKNMTQWRKNWMLDNAFKFLIYSTNTETLIYLIVSDFLEDNSSIFEYFHLDAHVGTWISV